MLQFAAEKILIPGSPIRGAPESGSQWEGHRLCAGVPATVRTLVLDDSPLLAQALAGLLCELCNLQLVCVCSAVADAELVIQQQDIDLLILDLERHGGQWEQVVRALLRRNPRARVVLLVADPALVRPPQELMPALLSVVDKNSDLTELLGAIIRWQAVGPAPAALPLEKLNPREQRVFQEIGKGLLNKQIAQSLNLTIATVESYRKAICAKFNLSGPELVRAAVLQRLVSIGVMRR